VKVTPGHRVTSGPRKLNITYVNLVPVDTWHGKVPNQTWVFGGTFEGMGTTWSPVPAPAMKPDSQWLVEVNEADGAILSALPILDGQVRMDAQPVQTDDVDGGDNNKAALAKAKAKAETS
jgi:hypothetical protein